VSLLRVRLDDRHHIAAPVVSFDAAAAPGVAEDEVELVAVLDGETQVGAVDIPGLVGLGRRLRAGELGDEFGSADLELAHIQSLVRCFGLSANDAITLCADEHQRQDQYYGKPTQRPHAHTLLDRPPPLWSAGRGGRCL